MGPLHDGILCQRESTEDVLVGTVPFVLVNYSSSALQ